MATKKSKAAEPAASKSTDGSNVITIDLQNLMTPIAIIVAGMMISLTLFFTLRDSTTSAKTTTTTTSDTTTTGTTTGTAQEGFADGTVNIGDDPVKGDKDKAKYAIVEFTDFECPFCQRHYQQTYGGLIEEFIDSGEAIYVLKDFPLDFHPQAMPAAVAASCARDQGGDEAFFDYHDKLFGEGVANGTADFEKYAQDLGLNMDEFKACADSDKFADEIATDVSEGGSAGVTGTPGFVVGTLSDDGTVTGKVIAGAYPLTDFQSVINEL